LNIEPGDWEKFDMRQRVMKSPLTEEQVKELTASLYKLFFGSKYMLKQITSIRNLDDIKYLYRGFKSITKKHLKDFSNKNQDNKLECKSCK
jgi:hypothetical protein